MRFDALQKWVLENPKRMKLKRSLSAERKFIKFYEIAEDGLFCGTVAVCEFEQTNGVQCLLGAAERRPEDYGGKPFYNVWLLGSLVSRARSEKGALFTLTRRIEYAMTRHEKGIARISAALPDEAVLR